MLPTLFKLPFLPDWLADVKSYGVMMMIAFLTGIWLACRRAYRSQADPDVVLNVGFLSLIFGVIGSRAMYVIHYWDTAFANKPSPLLAMLDIRAGGLEFWGGPLLVIPIVALYLRYCAKTSVRWYVDMIVPSLAWGLAITRIGCFLNGCCWGAVCLTDEHTDHVHREAALPWAVQFPYGSPAMSQQYEFGQLTLPKELIIKLETQQSFPVWRQPLADLIEDGGRTGKQLADAYRDLDDQYNKAMNKGADRDVLKRLEANKRKANEEHEKYRWSLVARVDAHCKRVGMTPTQLAELASHYRSQPVHPAQLYAVLNAFIISWVLSTMFYYRKRHGIVLGWFLILYSISRVFLELIRQDNPLDVGGGTISQAISVCTFTAGVVWLLVVHRLPLYSPRAVPFVPPEDDEEGAKPALKTAKPKK